MLLQTIAAYIKLWKISEKFDSSISEQKKTIIWKKVSNNQTLGYDALTGILICVDGAVLIIWIINKFKKCSKIPSTASSSWKQADLKKNFNVVYFA